MKDLVEIIKKNPGCIARIGNYRWEIIKDVEPPDGFENWSDERQDEWGDKQILVRSEDEFKSIGSGGCDSGNCYGGDILQALAAIIGIRIESI